MNSNYQAVVSLMATVRQLQNELTLQKQYNSDMISDKDTVKSLQKITGSESLVVPNLLKICKEQVESLKSTIGNLASEPTINNQIQNLNEKLVILQTIIEFDAPINELSLESVMNELVESISALQLLLGERNDCSINSLISHLQSQLSTLHKYIDSESSSQDLNLKHEINDLSKVTKQLSDIICSSSKIPDLKSINVEVVRLNNVLCEKLGINQSTSIENTVSRIDNIKSTIDEQLNPRKPSNSILSIAETIQKLVSDIYAKLGIVHVDMNVSSISTDLQNFISRINTITSVKQTNQTSLESSMKNIESKCHELRLVTGSTDNTFKNIRNAIDNHLNSMNSLVPGNAEKLTDVYQQTASKLTHLKNKLGAVNNRISTLDNKLSKEINELKKLVGDERFELTLDLPSNIQSINGYITSINNISGTKCENLNMSIQTLDNELSKIKELVHANANTIPAILSAVQLLEQTNSKQEPEIIMKLNQISGKNDVEMNSSFENINSQLSDIKTLVSSNNKSLASVHETLSNEMSELMKLVGKSANDLPSNIQNISAYIQNMNRLTNCKSTNLNEVMQNVTDICSNLMNKTNAGNVNFNDIMQKIDETIAEINNVTGLTSTTISTVSSDLQNVTTSMKELLPISTDGNLLEMKTKLESEISNLKEKIGNDNLNTLSENISYLNKLIENINDVTNEKNINLQSSVKSLNDGIISVGKKLNINQLDEKINIPNILDQINEMNKPFEKLVQHVNSVINNENENVDDICAKLSTELITLQSLLPLSESSDGTINDVIVKLIENINELKSVIGSNNEELDLESNIKLISNYIIMLNYLTDSDNDNINESLKEIYDKAEILQKTLASERCSFNSMTETVNNNIEKLNRLTGKEASKTLTKVVMNVDNELMTLKNIVDSEDNKFETIKNKMNNEIHVLKQYTGYTGTASSLPLNILVLKDVLQELQKLTGSSSSNLLSLITDMKIYMKVINEKKRTSNKTLKELADEM